MKYTKRILAFVLALVLCITLMPMTNASAKAKTRLNKKKATVYVGKSIKLQVKNKPAGKKVKWKSTDRKVATVKKGKVKAKRAGKATIVAKIGKKSYRCKLTVKKKSNNVNPSPEETPSGKYENPAEKPVESPSKPGETNNSVTTKPQEVTTKIPETTQPVEQPTTVPETTQPVEPPTTAPINFTTDSSIEKPFGMVVSSPENGMISVVWGKGNINCYNVYVDGERRRTAVPAASYTMPVYFEGNHTIAITTVVGTKESLKIEMQINVVGVGEKETEPETCPEELKPQLRDDIKLRDDRVVLQLNNKTNGKYTDKQIFWCLLGYNKTHQLCYLDKNGNLIPASTDMNTITVNNRLVADVSNTLEEAGYVYAPSIESGRLYISYEKPVYIAFNNAADGTIGFAGPDLNNPSDPNADTLFEFAEFTIDGKYYWGNTTRVDYFCFPMITRLIGHTQYEKYDNVVGDIGTREEIFNAFKDGAPVEFKTIVKDKRIMAPCKSTFNIGQPYADYFDNYINECWTKYTNEDLVFQCEGGTFRGRAEGNRMRFTRDGSPDTHYVDKPTTQEVLEGKGAFDRGTATEKVIEAQLCAAFNRGVATEPAKWNKPAEYYKGSIYNYYAGFFHEHSVVGRAYGFCYDDVNDQSTLLQYDHSDALIIDLKW